MTPSAMPQLLGRRYEVGELIGRGGMAEVFRGVDTRLGRPVAIKVLRSDLARDTNFLGRFRREAQSAAGLNHPSVVAIFDSGEDTSTDDRGATVTVPYIVMEVVEGETLRERLTRDTRVSPDEAARITEGVLSALAYSHRMGIVHRDIKPANVMVTTRGEVKVMDFGIARAVADSSATMTQTQAVIGTAQYLSPEQAQGQQVDARSDLYSAGCLLYELLAGRPPFVGDSPVSVAYQHVGEQAQPPSLFAPGVPAPYDTIALHALVKDRDRRYQSATEFRGDLAAARAGRPLSAAAAGSAAAAAATGSATTRLATDRSRDGDDEAATATRQMTRNGTATLPEPAREPGSLDTGGMPTVGRQLDPAPQRGRGAVAAVLTIVGIVALVIVLLAGRALLRQNAAPDTVAVPALQGKTVDQARSALESAQLVIAVNNVTNDTVPADQVIDSSPSAGTRIDVGTTVKVDVSTGPGQSTVPVVAGMTEAEATAAMKEVGLTVSTINPVDDPSQAKGDVVDTVPSAGSVVARTQPVTLDIATGKVPVPDLKGKHFSVGQATLGQDKLTTKIVEVENDALEGTVLEQTPAAGTVVDIGTEVTLTIAKRKPPTPSTTTVTVTPPPTGTSTDTPSTPPPAN